VAKHVDAVELRVIAAALLAVAADAVLVAHHLPKFCAHLVAVLARLNVHNLARRSNLEVGSTREKRAGGAEKRKKIRVVIMHEKQEIPVARSRDPKRENEMVLSLHSNLSSCGGRSKRAGCERVRSRKMCFGQMPIAIRQGRFSSVTTLSQQEKTNSADLQRGGFIPRGDVPSASSCRWPDNRTLFTFWFIARASRKNK
jgi:hypothetical protein